MLGVFLDVFAELEVDLEGFVDAAVEHAEPVAGGLLEFGHAEEVAGLDDDFDGVCEVMGEAADFDGEFFGDVRGVRHGGDSVARGARDANAGPGRPLTLRDGDGRLEVRRLFAPAFFGAQARLAEMAELADARGSGPRSRKGVEVRVLFSAPNGF